MNEARILSGVTQGSLWGAAAQDWAELQEHVCRPLWRDALVACRAGTGQKILDAGCGSGGASIEATKLGCIVTGLDASEPLLAVARKRLPDVRFDRGDLEELPYRDEVYDAALAINSVMYAADMARAIQELARVVRPGGRVVLTSWGKPEDCEMKVMLSAIGALLGPPKPGSGGPFALSAPGALDSLLRAAGLRPVASGESVCVFTYPSRDSYVRGNIAAGPLQNAIQKVGLDAVRSTVENIAPQFTDENGAIKLRNVFVWAAGEK